MTTIHQAMIERPETFTIKGHFFIGYVLVDGPQESKVGFGVSSSFDYHRPNTFGVSGSTDAWLPYACDLRRVTDMKQRTPEDTSTCLYTENGFLATVNATLEQLIPYWIEARRAP